MLLQFSLSHIHVISFEITQTVSGILRHFLSSQQHYTAYAVFFTLNCKISQKNTRGRRQKQRRCDRCMTDALMWLIYYYYYWKVLLFQHALLTRCFHLSVYLICIFVFVIHLLLPFRALFTSTHHSLYTFWLSLSSTSPYITNYFMYLEHILSGVNKMDTQVLNPHNFAFSHVSLPNDLAEHQNVMKNH